jgi:acetylornithine deacetylase
LEISFDHIVGLLKDLIKVPSFSREEKQTADIIENFFNGMHIPAQRKKNNIWVTNKYYVPHKPCILLNSHHDTVRPNPDWTRDPFTPQVENEKLFGLGSNDAGGSVTAMIASFLNFYDKDDLKYNLIFLASAEEEISGPNGVESVLNDIGKIDFGMVGEPTKMNVATAEKGLMVVDCMAKGISGHAARDVGKNAIYVAMQDILWIERYRFSLVSEILGPVKMTVTMVKAGTQHNVIPDSCEFVVDVRSTDKYSNEEIHHIMMDNMKSQLTPRSTRLQPSYISPDHILVKTARELGFDTFGSQTLSDQALMPFPTVKIGPGDSARSHTADEYIYIHEIEKGISGYNKLLNSIIHQS